MKHLFITVVLLLTYNGRAQSDRFNLFADVSCGMHELYYNSLLNQSSQVGGTSYWNEWVYSGVNYEIVHGRIYGLDFMPGFGIHLPCLNKERFSIGVELKGNIGAILRMYDQESIEGKGVPGDRLDLGGFKWHVPIELYFQHVYADAVVGVKGGYKFLSAYYDYATPTLGLFFTQRHVHLYLYSHLMREKYYRQYSTGELEMSRSYFEAGFGFSYFIFGERKK